MESVLGCLLHKLYALSLDGRPEVRVIDAPPLP